MSGRTPELESNDEVLDLRPAAAYLWDEELEQSTVGKVAVLEEEALQARPLESLVDRAISDWRPVPWLEVGSFRDDDGRVEEAEGELGFVSSGVALEEVELEVELFDGQGLTKRKTILRDTEGGSLPGRVQAVVEWKGSLTMEVKVRTWERERKGSIRGWEVCKREQRAKVSSRRVQERKGYHVPPWSRRTGPASCVLRR